jgi:Pre-rRNA-processing protein TSR2
MDPAQQKFTHSAALIIHSWSALDMAVQMELAGPESSNIRDWLGGVIVDMFSFPVEGGTGTGEKIPDRDDLEDVLLQVLEDEFELRLEDDSAYQVRSLCLWRLVSAGERPEDVSLVECEAMWRDDSGIMLRIGCGGYCEEL